MNLHSEMKFTFSIWFGICTLESSDGSTGSLLAAERGTFRSELSFAYSAVSWAYSAGS